MTDSNVTKISNVEYALKTIPRAVDEVCGRAAEEIEAAAKQVLVDANMVHDDLMLLASRIREHGRGHADRTTGFCNDLQSTWATVQKLKARHSGIPTADDKIIDERARMPHGPNISSTTVPENAGYQENANGHDEPEAVGEVQAEHPMNLDEIIPLKGETNGGRKRK